MTNPPRLLRLAEVIERTALSRSYIYVLIARGQFPALRQLGAKCSRWLESEIVEWIGQQQRAA